MTSLVLAGCGKMGGALLAGWLDRGLDPNGVTVVDPAIGGLAWAAERGVTVLPSAEDLAGTLQPDVVLFAVKPQMMAEVVPSYVRFADGLSVFLSIAAGRTLLFFENILGDAAPIVRSMPNTPAAVRRGMTVACANSLVSEAQRAVCQHLLEAVGEVAWVDDEVLLDAVTAVSGSGPAYVFLLAESLAAAGVEAGLPKDLATRLARATIAGAGELLHQSAESPDVLRTNVTSPGGTTAEALAVLMGPDGWQQTITRAVAAATRRSRELAG
jgi:pyrroline-5-carboxylate reductase